MTRITGQEGANLEELLLLNTIICISYYDVKRTYELGLTHEIELEEGIKKVYSDKFMHT